MPNCTNITIGHARRRSQERDSAIDAKLEKAGIQTVRILGSDIKFELPKAVSKVIEAVANAKK